MSGTTIGQWARRGYIRSSQSEGEPRVYSVEDVAEAAIVSTLLERGVPHNEVRVAIERLRDYGDWPLSEAPLATTRNGGRSHIVLREDGEHWVLTARGWQLAVTPPKTDDVRLKLRRVR